MSDVARHALSCHTCWNSSHTSRQLRMFRRPTENQLVCENQIFFTSWRIRSGYVRGLFTWNEGACDIDIRPPRWAVTGEYITFCFSPALPCYKARPPPTFQTVNDNQGL